MPNPYLHHVLKKKDSIRYKSRFSQKLDQFTDSRLYRMTYLGVPLIVAGFAVKSEDDHFRSLRNDYLPRFHHHADDYLQYAPAAVMLEMKKFTTQYALPRVPEHSGKARPHPQTWRRIQS